MKLTISLGHAAPATKPALSLPLGPQVYFLRGAEERRTSRVAEDVAPILGKLRLVHGHEGRAEGVRGGGDDRPLPPVVAYDPHPGVRYDAELVAHDLSRQGHVPP